MPNYATVDVKTMWQDDWLENAVGNSFVRASFKTAELARSSADSSAVARSIGTRFYGGGAASVLVSIVRASSPLAHLFELGVKPHAIAPKNSLQSLIERGRQGAGGKSRRVRTSTRGRIAMKFPDGGFARGSVNHLGMQARPFMRPAAAAFPALYNRELSIRLRY